MGVHFNRRGVAVAVLLTRRILVQNHVFGAEFRIRLFRLIHGVHVFRIIFTLVGIRQINRQPQIRNDVPTQAGKGILIRHMITQGFNMLARVLHHMLAPVLNHMLCTGRKFSPSELLSDQQAHSHRQRRVRLGGNGVKGRLFTLHLKVRIKVLSNALHAHSPKGGDTGRLNPLKHFLSRTAVWAVQRMQSRVVMLKTEGKFVTNATHSIDFALVCAHRRQRQTQCASTNHRRARAKGHIQFVVPGDRPDSCRGRTLERV